MLFYFLGCECVYGREINSIEILFSNLLIALIHFQRKW